MSDPTLVLSYDVFSLPTAQHRAGLAGLLVLIDSLKKRDMGPVPEIENPEFGQYRFHWTQESLRTVFNEFYDASMEEIPRNNKRQGQEPKRTEKKINPKKDKEETIYFYDQLTPKFNFLRSFEVPEIWIKLWRDCIWGIFRSRDKERIPYKNRNDGRDAIKIKELWEDLQKVLKNRNQGKVSSTDVASNLFIGSQSHNAEMIKFKGSQDENLLLHFWPVVMGVYQPEIIDIKGQRKFVGFVLIIPNVIDMEGFVQDYPPYLSQLSSEVAGFRPKKSIISIHNEGGLAYASQLLQITQAKGIKSTPNRFNITGVEVYHIEKKGNNISLLSSDYLKMDQRLLEDYEIIAQKYNNPLFRRQMILNLLDHKPWFLGFEQIFSTLPSDFFMGNDWIAKSFSMDVSTKFNIERSHV